jgi:hypothetical protein
MPYPWPLAEANPALDKALQIAMGYLEDTGRAYPYSETQRRVANAILAAWQSGVRHQIRLANYGIAAIEQKMKPAEMEQVSFYPRVS